MTQIQQHPVEFGYGSNEVGAPPPQEKTVILLGKENLFGSVVESILGSVNTWKIVRISEDHDRNTLVQDIKALNPGVVILYEDKQSIELSLFIQLLEECPELRVITVSPESNSLQIYSKQRVWIKSPSDFISIMEG
jgi:hypothetical protein